MAFKGDLSTIGLADLFQTLTMSHKEGTLIVQDGESRKSIYFGRDGISLTSIGKRKHLRLGELLLRAGKITQKQLTDLLELQRKTKTILGELIVKMQLATDNDITNIVKSQIEEEIYDLFIWQNATFEFIEGPPPSEFIFSEGITKLSFDVNALLLEAMRRADEWGIINQKIKNLDTVYAVDPSFTPQHLNKKESEILRLIDGKNSISDISLNANIPKIEICKFLMTLIDKNVLNELQIKETTNIVPVAPENLLRSTRTTTRRIRRKKVLTNAVFIMVFIAMISVTILYIVKFLKESNEHVANTTGTKPTPINTDTNAVIDAAKDMEQLVSNTEGHYNTGNLTQALETAKRLKVLAEKYKDEAYLMKANELLDMISSYINNAQIIFNRVRELESRGDIKNAALAVEELIHKYPRSEIAKNSYYPLKITSTPSAVSVYKNNSLKGVTPIILRISQTENTTIKLIKGGYEATTFEIIDKTVGYMHTTLNKNYKLRIPIGGVVDTTPTIFSGKLLVTSKDKLYILDATNGTYISSFTADGDIETSPQVTGSGVVLFGSNDNYLYAVDIKDVSKELWKFKTLDFVRSSPTISSDGSIIYFGGSDRNLYAITAAGSKIWSVKLSADIRAKVSIANNIIYIGCLDGSFYAINSTDGSILWQFKASGSISLQSIIVNNNIVLTSANGNIYYLNRNGNKIWEMSTNNAITSGPESDGTSLYIGDTNGSLYSINPGSGKVEWQYKTGGSIYSSPTVSGGYILVGSDDGNMYCLSNKTGGLIWKFTTGDKVRSKACVAGNLIYFGSNDRNIYVVERD